MRWMLSYMGANGALIMVVVLAVAALGALAWLSQNWKLAVAAAAILAAGLGYQQIDRNAYQRRVAEEAAQQVRTLQGRLDALSKIADADAARAREDALYIAALESQASATPPNTAPSGIDADAARRIGSIR